MPAEATNTLRVAFIGFGEVGQTFSRDLLRCADVRIVAYDILASGAAGSRLVNKAQALGVEIAQTAADALDGAAIIFSAVTASQAERVAESASKHLKAGQIYLDVNSSAPETKQSAARHVVASGASYIECAVMAPVLKPGLAVPILAGGPDAEIAATRMNGMGMNLAPVATDYGRASAMKLCRSIMIKGLEALIVDCAQACDRFDVRKPVFASLAETFPSIDWHVLAETMAERVATHGVRRSEEMREAGIMLAALDLDPGLALAVADAQQRGALKAKGHLV